MSGLRTGPIVLLGPCARTALPVYDRTDNPNAVHAIMPDTRVFTVTDNGKSQWLKSLG